jgi:hypothetical protein
MFTVAAHTVAEVLLQEDLRAAREVATRSWLQWGSQAVTAYADYWGVETRLVAYHWYTWWQQGQGQGRPWWG